MGDIAWIFAYLKDKILSQQLTHYRSYISKILG